MHKYKKHTRCKCGICRQWADLSDTEWQPVPDDPEYIQRVCKLCRTKQTDKPKE
jgi:hypothetical protein